MFDCVSQWRFISVDNFILKWLWQKHCLNPWVIYPILPEEVCNKSVWPTLNAIDRCYLWFTKRLFPKQLRNREIHIPNYGFHNNNNTFKLGFMIMTGHYFRLNSNNAIWRPPHTHSRTGNYWEQWTRHRACFSLASGLRSAVEQWAIHCPVCSNGNCRADKLCGNGHVLKCGLRVHCLHVLTEWNIIRPVFRVTVNLASWNGQRNLVVWQRGLSWDIFFTFYYQPGICLKCLKITVCIHWHLTGWGLVGWGLEGRWKLSKSLLNTFEKHDTHVVVDF